jgi:hypothetical protein
MCGRAEDSYAVGGVLDDREDVEGRAVGVLVSRKSAARMAWAWERGNVAQVVW